MTSTMKFTSIKMKTFSLILSLDGHGNLIIAKRSFQVSLALIILTLSINRMEPSPIKIGYQSPPLMMAIMKYGNHTLMVMRCITMVKE